MTLRKKDFCTALYFGGLEMVLWMHNRGLSYFPVHCDFDCLTKNKIKILKWLEEYQVFTQDDIDKLYTHGDFYPKIMNYVLKRGYQPTKKALLQCIKRHEKIIPFADLEILRSKTN